MRFEFTKYEFLPSEKKAVFYYATHFDDGKILRWHEAILLPKPAGEIPTVLLESLHLMLGISYWKFYPSLIVRQPYQLTKQQADFFNTVYKNGLGEFFYRNNLDPTMSPKFEARNQKSETNPKISNFEIRISDFPSQALVGVGGGKDSIVTAELLKEHGFDFNSFFVG